MQKWGQDTNINLEKRTSVFDLLYLRSHSFNGSYQLNNSNKEAASIEVDSVSSP